MVGSAGPPAGWGSKGEAWRRVRGRLYLRGQTPDAVAYGANGDIPVPSDYDGDGIADLTVFRPSNGTWYLENGQAIAWGIATDIPLPLPYAVRNAYFAS